MRLLCGYRVERFRMEPYDIITGTIDNWIFVIMFQLSWMCWMSNILLRWFYGDHICEICLGIEMCLFIWGWIYCLLSISFSYMNTRMFSTTHPQLTTTWTHHTKQILMMLLLINVYFKSYTFLSCDLPSVREIMVITGW